MDDSSNLFFPRAVPTDRKLRARTVTQPSMDFPGYGIVTFLTDISNDSAGSDGNCDCLRTCPKLGIR
jgi:hypothetical protein